MRWFIAIIAGIAGLAQLASADTVVPLSSVQMRKGIVPLPAGLGSVQMQGYRDGVEGMPDELDLTLVLAPGTSLVFEDEAKDKSLCHFGTPIKWQLYRQCGVWLQRDLAVSRLVVEWVHPTKARPRQTALIFNVQADQVSCVSRYHDGTDTIALCTLGSGTSAWGPVALPEGLGMLFVDSIDMNSYQLTFRRLTGDGKNFSRIALSRNFIDFSEAGERKVGIRWMGGKNARGDQEEVRLQVIVISLEGVSE